MRNVKLATLLATAPALLLAACGDANDDADMMAVNDDNELMVDEPDYDSAFPVAGALTDAQQENLDAMDSESVSQEYDRNQTAMMEEAANNPQAGTNANAMGGTNTGSNSAGDNATGSDTNMGNMAGGQGAMSGSSDGVAPLRPRSQMDFAFLDRNSDGQLSVAEYAIWAVPANPRSRTANDERPPYLTQAQINEGARTFFYFDEDGSTYLSEQEFERARSSSRTPG